MADTHMPAHTWRTEGDIACLALSHETGSLTVQGARLEANKPPSCLPYSSGGYRVCTCVHMSDYTQPFMWELLPSLCQYSIPQYTTAQGVCVMNNCAVSSAWWLRWTSDYGLLYVDLMGGDTPPFYEVEMLGHSVYRCTVAYKLSGGDAGFLVVASQGLWEKSEAYF